MNYRITIGNILIKLSQKFFIYRTYVGINIIVDSLVHGKQFSFYSENLTSVKIRV